MRSRALLFAALAVLLYFGGLAALPLLEPDEGRYEEIPREMLSTGDLVTPHLNGVLYFEKPPLYYWLCATSLATFGRNEFAARFWSALFGLGDIVLAYALARSMNGIRAGTFAAVILATAPLHTSFARADIIDPTLTFFLDSSLVCFWLAHRREPGPARTALWLGTFAAAALAVLSKGLIGIVIPGAVIGLYLLSTRQWQVLRKVPWLVGMGLFLGMAAPWHVLAAHRNPGFLWVYFVREHLLRYTTPIASHEQPFWFFGAVLLVGLLPWCGLLPRTASLFKPWSKIAGKRHLLFLTIWAGFVVLFFSASHSKLVPYVLPAVLPLLVLSALGLEAAIDDGSLGLARWGMALASLLLAAIGLGCVFMSLGSRGGPASRWLLLFGALTAAASAWSVGAWLRRDGSLGLAATSLAAVFLLGSVGSVVGLHTSGRTARPIAAYLQEQLGPEDEVFCYRRYFETLPPYLDRLVGVVEYTGELEFGISKLPDAERARRYPTAAEFRPLWESYRNLYLVAREEDFPSLSRDGLNPATVLWRDGTLMLLVNR